MNQQHQRRSIRLQTHDYSSDGAYFVTVCAEARGADWFGAISSSGMQLNAAGEMVRRELERLPERFSNLEIDECVVMPDHVHVIFVLHEDADTRIRRGEPRVRPVTHAERNSKPNQLEEVSRSTQGQEPRPANESGSSRFVPGEHEDRPYENPSGTQSGSIGRIVQAFKSVTTVNYIRGVRESGWQSFEKRFWERNYWERVLRDDAELEVRRAYITQNPMRQWLNKDGV